MAINPKNPAKEWLYSYLSPSLSAAKAYGIDAPQVRMKLDQNESPFDWPQDLKEKIAQKLQAVGWNRYPSASNPELEELVAAYAGVHKDAVLLSPGSNHLITLLLNMLNQRRAGKLVMARPSFPLYEQWSNFQGFSYDSWPLNSNLQYDFSLLPDLPPSSLLIFASPNNPVGNVLPYDDLRRLLAANPHSFVIADEAYFEFANRPYTPLLAEFANLILVRTFSKTLGAAGVRLGYCLASPLVIEQLRKLMLPYLLNHFTVIAIGEALTNQSLLQKIAANRSQVIEEREGLYQQLTNHSGRGFEVLPSQANFLLLRWPDQERCLHAYHALIAAGILLRNVSAGPGLKGCLRLTVGNPQENAAFLQAIRGL